MNKKYYIGYLVLMLAVIIFDILNVFEIDKILNGALTILCAVQLLTVMAVPTMGRLTSSRNLEEQMESKTPAMSWKTFFLIVIPLIICVFFTAGR